jgi:hypothetical protein
MSPLITRPMRGLLAMALMGTALSTLAASPWPDMPAPPKGRVAWVAKDVWINGIPSRIQQFESVQDPSEVIAHYRAHWQLGDAGPPREETARGWITISTLRGPYSLVVQVKPKDASGSQGLISALNIKEPKSKYIPPDWPALRDVQVKQVMESVDGNLRSFYVVATSTQSSDRLRDQMKSIWDLQPASYMGTYVREGKTMEMAITKDARQGAVNLVVNMVQAAQE